MALKNALERALDKPVGYATDGALTVIQEKLGHVGILRSGPKLVGFFPFILSSIVYFPDKLFSYETVMKLVL